MRRINLSYVALKLEFLLLAGIIWFTMLKNPDTVSLLFMGTFIVLFFSVARQFWEQTMNGLHICVIICLAIAFFNVLVTAEVVSFTYLRKFIIFSCTVLLFVYVYKMEVSRELVAFILKINVVIALLYPVSYYLLDVRTLYARGLTFNFSNPNLTGMYLLHSLLYCVLALQYFKGKIFKVAMLTLIVQLYFFMEATLARACMLAFWGFLAFAAASYFWGGKITVTPLVSFLMLAMPIIFVFIYLYLCENGVFAELTHSKLFAIQEGKSFTTRRLIWEISLNYYKSSPIVGAYGDIGGVSGASQLHNTHLDVLVSYGTVPFILFVAVLNLCVNRVLKSIRFSYQKMALFAFYAVIISGTFEAALVSGGMGLYVLSCGFLIIAKYNGLLVKERENEGIE